jgi:hypothetical protein
LQLHPLPDALCNPSVAPDSEKFTLTKPELAEVPPLWTVIVSVPVPPATNGTPPSATLRLRSTGLLPVTGVEIDAELSLVLPSLAFDTDALNWIDPSPLDVGTATVTVIAGSDPPADTGPGLVHNSFETLQLQPLPEAACAVAEDTEKFTLTRPELAVSPLLSTVIVSVPVPPETTGAPPSAMFSVKSVVPVPADAFCWSRAATPTSGTIAMSNSRAMDPAPKRRRNLPGSPVPGPKVRRR